MKEVSLSERSHQALLVCPAPILRSESSSLAFCLCVQFWTWAGCILATSPTSKVLLSPICKQTGTVLVNPKTMYVLCNTLHLLQILHYKYAP